MLKPLGMETLVTVLFYINLFFFSWWAYIFFFNKGVPNIPTAPVIRRRVVALIKADYEAKGRPQDYTVVDLGSGSGSYARMIAKALPEVKVIGIEWDKRAVWWAEMMKKITGVKNVDYKCCDFNAYHIGHVDAVVLFLTAYNMHSMGKKLREELKSGALIACNRFTLQEGWEPTETIMIRTLYPLQGKLNIYRQ